MGALLAETLGRPDLEFTLAELGRRTDLGGAVVHREVGRLVDAGVLLDRVEGRNRLVRANSEHPLFVPMAEIIDRCYGPVPVLREAFANVEDADQVLIYGSWASRRSGDPGAFPRDLDVLVVGEVPRRTLSEIAAAAGERLGLPVNITRLSIEDWESASPSPFVATVRSRPLVEVKQGDVHG